MPEAARLADICGVTHVAVGTLTGASGRERLEYTLLTVPDGKPIGTPIVSEGTESQILAQLPTIADAIDARLGITPQSRPMEAGMRPEDIRLIGSLQTQAGPLTDSQRMSVFHLAEDNPLACITCLEFSGSLTAAATWKVGNRLLSLIPENPFAYGQVALTCSPTLADAPDALNAVRRAHPHSALLAYATVMRDRITCDWREEQAESAQDVRAAPRNPEAWLTYAATVKYAGSRLRKARTSDAISSSEWAALNADYDRETQAAKTAVRLDPLYGKAWMRLAEAATFAGKNDLAETALGKAMALYPEKNEVYDWGLEMLSPKWIDAPQSFDAVARLAASARYDDAGSVLDMVRELKACGQTECGQSLHDWYVARYRAAITANANDGKAHWDLATLLKDDDILAAWTEYKTATDLLPNEPKLLFDLGETRQEGGSLNEALAAYDEVLALDPRCERAALGAGSIKLIYGDLPAAQDYLETAVKLNPSDGIARCQLGQLYEQQGKDAAAEGEHRASIERTDERTEAYGCLSLLLVRLGRTDEALPVTLTGLRLRRDDVRCLDALAEISLARKDLDDAAKISEHVLTLRPNDPWADEHLGDVALQKGDLEDARRYWTQVAAIKIGGGYPTEVAAKRLAQYPEGSRFQ